MLQHRRSRRDHQGCLINSLATPTFLVKVELSLARDNPFRMTSTMKTRLCKRQLQHPSTSSWNSHCSTIYFVWFFSRQIEMNCFEKRGVSVSTMRALDGSSGCFLYEISWAHVSAFDSGQDCLDVNLLIRYHRARVPSTSFVIPPPTTGSTCSASLVLVRWEVATIDTRALKSSLHTFFDCPAFVRNSSKTESCSVLISLFICVSFEIFQVTQVAAFYLNKRTLFLTRWTLSHSHSQDEWALINFLVSTAMMMFEVLINASMLNRWCDE